MNYTNGSPSPEVTDVFLQSSLSIVIPYALVFLHLTTSVRFRYGFLFNTESFSWDLIIVGHSPQIRRSGPKRSQYSRPKTRIPDHKSLVAPITQSVTICTRE